MKHYSTGTSCELRLEQPWVRWTAGAAESSWRGLCSNAGCHQVSAGPPPGGLSSASRHSLNKAGCWLRGLALLGSGHMMGSRFQHVSALKVTFIASGMEAPSPSLGLGSGNQNNGPSKIICRDEQNTTEAVRRCSHVPRSQRKENMQTGKRTTSELTFRTLSPCRGLNN